MTWYLAKPLMARKALPQGETWVRHDLATPQSLAYTRHLANFGDEDSSLSSGHLVLLAETPQLNDIALLGT